MGAGVVVKQVLLAEEKATFVTCEVPFIEVELGGVPGDRHYGLLRPADSRQKIYSRGTMLANRRQISIVSVEECELIAEAMGLPLIKPEWLGANLLISGIDKLTELPVGTRLLFPGGTGLICEGENLPCIAPGKVIEEASGQAVLRSKFVPAARKRRGIVCSVEREGSIKAGDSVRVMTVKV